MEKASANRVVVLIDMDCFYCQVEEKLDPELQGKPIAVVQYNPWKGGGIIAVNYVARAMGVTRHMRGDEAKEICPEIQLPSVPCSRGKADISKYREAGKDVARVLQKYTPLLERASIDEAYLDITEPVLQRLKVLNINYINPDTIPNTYALGYNCVEDFIRDIKSDGNGCLDFDYENAKQLLAGAVIVSEIREAVYKETGFRCSAGIAHNKILAKLVCGMNKPNKQTILPKNSINILYETLPVKRVKHLGGKFGCAVCEKLKINNMGELQAFSEADLQVNFDEKNGTWLYNIARGIDLEPVQARFNPKSIGCCKQFKGKAALLDFNSLKKWLRDLGDEIEDRLEKDSLENSRTPKQMVVSFSVQLPDGSDTSSSRSYNFMTEDELLGDFFSNKALELVLESAEGVKSKEEEGNRKLKAPIKFLGISVGKFEENSDSKKTKKIMDYFTSNQSKENHKVNNQSKNKPANKKTNDSEFILKRFFQANENTKIQDKVIAQDIKLQSLGLRNHVATFDSTNSQQDEVQNIFISQDIKLLTVEPTNRPKDKLEKLIFQNNKMPSSNFANHGTIEPSLDKQESFFAKFLVKDKVAPTPRTEIRPTTPLCNVIAHGDDSNDSEYSGSTIDMEINKSIALFEDDPGEVDRVSSIRQLLSSTALHKECHSTETPLIAQSAHEEKTFVCSDCSRSFSDLVELQTHLDYHMALKLRDEERQLLKTERQQSGTTNQDRDSQAKLKKVDTCKPESFKSIESFLIKVDNTVPNDLCAECGRRIALDKFTEHLDFHAAQKINRELNSKLNAAACSSGNSVKRKLKSLSPTKKPKQHCRSIDSFFR